MDRYTLDWSERGSLGAGAYGFVRVAKRNSDGLDVAVKFIALPHGISHLVIREATLLHYLQSFATASDVYSNPSIELIETLLIKREDIRPLQSAALAVEAPEYLILITTLYNSDLAGIRIQNIFSDFSAENYVFCWRSLIRALSLLHTRGITHSDIKPSNILLDQKGFVHFADFGMSKIELSSGWYDGLAGNQASFVDRDCMVFLPYSTGTSCTILYRAPEQLFNVSGFVQKVQTRLREMGLGGQRTVFPPVSSLGDVWSMCLIVLESLTSRVIYSLGADERYAHKDRASQDTSMRLCLLETYGSAIVAMYVDVIEFLGILTGKPLRQNEAWIADMARNHILSLLPENDKAYGCKCTKKEPVDIRSFIRTLFLFRLGRYSVSTPQNAHLEAFISALADCLSPLLSRRRPSQTLVGLGIFAQDSTPLTVLLKDGCMYLESRIEIPQTLEASVVKVVRYCTKGRPKILDAIEGISKGSQVSPAARSGLSSVTAAYLSDLNKRFSSLPLLFQDSSVAIVESLTEIPSLSSLYRPRSPGVSKQTRDLNSWRLKK